MSFSEVDIRPAELLREFLRLNAEDGARLLTDPGAFQYRDCPGCGSNANRSAFEKNGYTVVTCTNCQSLFVNPAPTDSALAAFYSASASSNYWATTFFPAVAETRRIKIFQPRVKRILSLIDEFEISPNVLIDVGAGAGLFLNEFGTVSTKSVLRAVEPGDILAAGLGKAGYDVFKGFAFEASQDCDWSSSADIVTCFEVIEHISDVAGLIKSLRDLCRPGGILVVTGLCGTGFDIQLLGRHAKAVSPPQHITFLSRSGVENVLSRCGLELLAFLTPGELDVDIVKNAVMENRLVISDRFVSKLVLEGSAKALTDFQKYLRNNNMSSHMWIVARRPK